MSRKAVFTSHRQDWRTSRALYQALDAEFGFDFDPCPANPDFDGLAVPWGSVNFCNPPYSEVRQWVAKAAQEAAQGKVVVLLIPARTDTIWWHEHIMRADEIRFIKGRLRFGDGPGRATFPSAIVVWRGGERISVEEVNRLLDAIFALR